MHAKYVKYYLQKKPNFLLMLFTLEDLLSRRNEPYRSTLLIQHLQCLLNVVDARPLADCLVVQASLEIQFWLLEVQDLAQKNSCSDLIVDALYGNELS